MILQIIILSLRYLLMAILGILVRIMLKPYSAQMDDGGIKGAGFTIGIFERILIYNYNNLFYCRLYNMNWKIVNSQS